MNASAKTKLASPGAYLNLIPQRCRKDRVRAESEPDPEVPRELDPEVTSHYSSRRHGRVNAEHESRANDHPRTHSQLD